MSDNISKADEIVGIREATQSMSQSRLREKLRRGAYFEWLDEHDAIGLGPGAMLSHIADEVIRIHAEETQPKPPDDNPFRRLLAAFDLYDKKPEHPAYADALILSPGGCLSCTSAPSVGANVVCWLAPRSKP